MAGVNKVILLGNLGRDPELTYTQSGMATCRLSIATSDKRKDGTEVTQWHRCVAFERRAEVIAKHFRKGSKIYIEGKLSYGQYEKDGIKHYTTDIIVNSFEFIESRGDAGQQGSYAPPQGGGYQKPPQQGGGYAPPGGYQPPPHQPSYQGQGNGYPDDDDIPF